MDVWANTGTGDWFTPTNWSLNAVPDDSNGYQPRINNGTAILSNGTVTTASTSIGGTFGYQGTLTVNGTGTQLDADGIEVGRGGWGTMNVQNGAIVNGGTAGLSINLFGNPSQQYSIGQVFVTGEGSQFNGYSTQIGGGGLLRVSNGASVNSGTSAVVYGGPQSNQGSLTIEGVGTYFSTSKSSPYAYNTGGIVMREGGHSQLFISDGATVSTEGDSYIGSVSNSNAIAYVQSSGTQWNNAHDLYVGGKAGSFPSSVGANGTLLIGSSGQVNVSNVLYVGNNPGTKGTIRLYSSGNLSAGVLVVGNYGDGTLTVEGLSQVNTYSLSLGYHSGSNGTAVIRQGSTVTVGSTSAGLGLSGNANLTLESGGILKVTSTLNTQGRLNIAESATSTATLNIGAFSGNTTAGTLDAKRVVFGSGTGRINFNQPYDTTFTADISGNGSVVQRGLGTTYLTGNNSHSGGTTISNGKLVAASVANLGTGSVTIGNGFLAPNYEGNLDMQNREIILTGAGGIDTNHGTVTLGGNVTGAGLLSIKGGGSFLLTGDATHGGGTTASENTGLYIGNGGTTGSIAGNIENNSYLVFNRSNDIGFNGIISGTGNVIKLGGGTLTFTNINSYTGATIVDAGTLTVNGAIAGPGGLVSVANGATLNGSGTLNRDITVSAGGTLASSLVVTGQVTLSNQHNVGEVSGGTETAASGQQLNVTTATGGTINATAGTAQIADLDGAELQTGNWGATVTNLTSGTVNTSGGALVAQQGTFNGTISGSGALVKSGAGDLILTTPNTYQGGTHVTNGQLTANTTGATGVGSVSIAGNGTFVAAAGVIIDAPIILESPEALYKKTLGAGESLQNIGTIQSNQGVETSVRLAAGSVDTGLQVEASFSEFGNFGGFLSDRLSLKNLGGTTFMLVMSLDINPDWNAQDVYISWFDPSEGRWRNSVEGNLGLNNNIQQFQETSVAEFLGPNSQNWNPTTMLGSYGYSSETGEMWAVLDHNSDFAAVPEPNTLALLGLGTVLLALRHRKART